MLLGFFVFVFVFFVIEWVWLLVLRMVSNWESNCGVEWRGWLAAERICISKTMSFGSLYFAGTLVVGVGVQCHDVIFINRIFDSSYVLGCGRGFKISCLSPLNINILHNICTHICALRCIVYTLPF